MRPCLSPWDNVLIRQNGGPDLLTDGDFENSSQQPICNTEYMFKDPCELDYWRHSPLTPLPCPVPWADADQDGDVDQDDFGVFQLCITGSDSGPVASGCECFDRPELTKGDGDIDQSDVTAFEKCATGPDLPLDVQNPPPGCTP